MAVGKAQALAGEPVDIRRVDARRAVAADVAVTEIIRVNEKDVRLGILRPPNRSEHQGKKSR